MSQPTKESIQQRLAILKKQAGFAFHNDLFISILLCLISGRDKHLILTAATHRLPEVSQMATLICRCLFGFSTANVICHQNQNPSDLVHSLFAATRDEYTESTEHRNSSHKLFGDSLHPPSDSGSRHRSAQSMQALDSRPSLLSYPSFKTMGNRNHYEEDNRSLHPVSPIDFNVPTRRRSPPQNIRYTHLSTDRRDTMSAASSSRKESEYAIGEPLQRTSSGKIAQSVIIQRLHDTNELVQATLLELIVAKELKISNARHTVPKPYFIVIAVLPQNYKHTTTASQLLDRFFVSYNFDEDAFGSFGTPRGPVRRTALVKNEKTDLYYYINKEIKALASQVSRVYVNIDITRYIRDIVVGIRTHPLIQGGLTARASQEFVLVTKALAALFQRDYLTPDLVTIAADKVLGHRIRVLRKENESQTRAITDVVADVLRIVYVP
ncbi:hypothetical protein INT45_002094, partial [Circinella minor]